MDTTRKGAIEARQLLESTCRNRRVLSVGDNLGGTVLQLAQITERLWQVPFCYPGDKLRARLGARRHTENVSTLVDAGRLVQIDGDPRLVLCNLHEDAFDVAFLHGNTEGPRMVQYLSWVKHLCSTIIVHDPGTQEARDAVYLFAQEQGVPVISAGLLTKMSARVASRGGTEGWL